MGISQEKQAMCISNRRLKRIKNIAEEWGWHEGDEVRDIIDYISDKVKENKGAAYLCNLNLHLFFSKESIEDFENTYLGRVLSEEQIFKN